MMLAWKGSSMSGILTSSQHWRKLAGDARRHAAGIMDVESKQVIFNVADGYDFLARQADDRAEEDRLLRETGWGHRVPGNEDPAPVSNRRYGARGFPFGS
jgi:hypothetical protein